MAFIERIGSRRGRDAVSELRPVKLMPAYFLAGTQQKVALLHGGRTVAETEARPVYDGPARDDSGHGMALPVEIHNALRKIHQASALGEDRNAAFGGMSEFLVQ